MYCNIVRLCICVDGYKLDESGETCVKDQAPVSEIDCVTIDDCVRLPNSYCNDRTGITSIVCVRNSVTAYLFNNIINHYHCYLG